MKRVKLICNVLLAALAAAFLFSDISIADTTNQISQFGITWTFNGQYTYGQFANGDYWVVGPVTIIAIDPPSREISGRTMNGSMINPIPGSTSFRQGYDSAPKDAASSYDANLNVALNVGVSKSLYVPSNSSLISAISLPTPNSWPQLQTAAILTVLPSAPPAGSFRPPYCGTDKSVKFNKASLDYSILLDLPLVSGAPTLSTIEGKFARPWLDHEWSYQMTRLMPSDNMPCYGREIGSTIGEGAVALNLNWSGQSRETLYIRMVQLGIDLYGAYQAGMTWMPDGGIYSGRKLPILLAGYALASDPDAQGMKNIGFNPPNDPYFQEDADTFYVSEADLVRYPSNMLGIPEWGIRHATTPSQDNYLWDTPYRRSANANSWAGIILAVHIMGLKSTWNHDALFDYQDRYMGIETPNTFNRQQIRWVEVAWDTYRSQFGPVWPNTSQNNPPVANAGQDRTVTGANGMAQITLDGSLSSDGDGTIQNYVWSEGGTQIGAGQTATITLAEGVHTVTLKVTDDDGAIGTDSAIITVIIPTVNPLIGYWRFDETGGTSAADSSGYGSNGLLVNGPVWTAGIVENGLKFDGNNDTVEISTSRMSFQKGSVVMWVKADSFKYQYLFGHATQPWSNLIQLYTDGQGYLYLGLGNSHELAPRVYKFQAGQWYHVALTWNGGAYQLYVNANVVSTSAYSGLAALESYADIGNNGNRSVRVEAFDGIIDEARLYSVALTVGQVADLFNNLPPEIEITSPADNTGVASGTVLVEGTVHDINLSTVEVMVEGFTDWQAASVNEDTFSCSVSIPTDGTRAVIIAKATDSCGSTATDEVCVIKGYLRFIELPTYYQKSGNVLNLSSIAAAQDIIDLMRPEPDSAFPTDADIYNYAHAMNVTVNQGLAELDPRGMDAALEHYDIYTQGYNYGIDTFVNMNDYLRDIVHWMSWPVCKDWGVYPPAGIDPEDPAYAGYFADEPYIPIVLPLYADTEGYSRWVVANGCAADIDPFEYNTQPWKYAYNIISITVYGLFLTDPDTSGIGQNAYIASAELDSYLKPMPLSAISNKYCIDTYSGKYVLVAEPPEEECELKPEIAPPMVNQSTLNLVRIAEEANRKDKGILESHLTDSILMVKLDENEAEAYFLTDSDLEVLFEPGKMPKDDTLKISWKDIIDPMLLLDAGFKEAIRDTVAREFIKVKRKDTQEDYYIIPLDKHIEGRFLSYAAIMVDAKDGHFIQATYVEEPTRYVQITEEEAIAVVIAAAPQAGSEKIEARLIWEPGGMTLSPFYPYWEVSAGGNEYYVAAK